MRKLFATTAACLLLVQTAFAAEFAGSYDVAGTDPGGGGSYAGVVTIRKTGDATYQVTWVIGNDTFIGTGIGSTEGLAVAYKSGPNIGVAIYNLGQSGMVEGFWTYAGGKQIGQEKWTPR